MTAPQVGDRVRATCGESVLVGTVSPLTSGTYVSVMVDREMYDRALHRSKWSFEVLTPPPWEGAVAAVDGHGASWVRLPGGMWVAVYAEDDTSCKRSPGDIAEAYGPIRWLS